MAPRLPAFGAASTPSASKSRRPSLLLNSTTGPQFKSVTAQSAGTKWYCLVAEAELRAWTTSSGSLYAAASTLDGKSNPRPFLIVGPWQPLVPPLLPPVPDFPGCPGFAPCCPASRQDQPRDAKCPGFQGSVKMSTTTIIIAIVINGVVVII